MKHEWWKLGWHSQFQTVHSMIQGAWCYSKYWHHPSSDVLVVLLHGQLANSHWWRPIAGRLAEKYCVLAVDFSGMGDSQWRECYDFQTHVNEVMHVIDLMARKQIVTVGHSYGGLVGLALAASNIHGHQGHMMVDSPLMALFDENKPSTRQSSRFKAQIVHYPSQKAICERFRLIPAQPILIPELAEAVAFHSATQDNEGWRWKFDPHVLAFSHSGGRLATKVSPELTYIAGEKSVFWNDRYKDILKTHHIQLEMISEGYHALPLDVPEALYVKISQQLKRIM